MAFFFRKSDFGVRHQGWTRNATARKQAKNASFSQQLISYFPLAKSGLMTPPGGIQCSQFHSQHITTIRSIDLHLGGSNKPKIGFHEFPGRT